MLRAMMLVMTVDLVVCVYGSPSPAIAHHGPRVGIQFNFGDPAPPDYYWVDGYWFWGPGWVWVPGHYEGPQGRYIWREEHWYGRERWEHGHEHNGWGHHNGWEHHGYGPPGHM